MTRPTSDAGSRFVTLLLSTTVATYVLIALGTAVSTTGSGDTCTTWPSCSTDWTIGPLSGADLLFLGHRGVALLAGVLLLWTVVTARGIDLDRRIRLALALAVGLFPVQIGFGALLVTTDSTVAGVAHLVLAMVLFVALLGALALALETIVAPRDETAEPIAPADDDVTPRVDPPDTGVTRDGDSSEIGTAPDGDSSEVGIASVVDSPADESGDADDPDSRLAGGSLGRLRLLAGAYLTLMKPKLMWLLCLVAVAGMGLATLTGASLEAGAALATLTGGVLAIGASGTFNHVYERDRDRRMERTADRPLVHDLVPVRNAVVFGLALTFGSAAVVLTWVNLLATILTLAAIGYYVVLYTVVLKPNTAWNTVLGGGAGALPALIGWASVTGRVGLPAIVLAAIIFLWTPAHFYSLAIAYRDDYARGGFPMFPVVEGVLAARRHILWYLGATLLAVSLLGWIAGLGWVYVLTSVALGVVFLRSVVRQYRVPTESVALRSFYVSNYYLGAILLAVVVETLVIAG